MCTDDDKKLSTVEIYYLIMEFYMKECGHINRGCHIFTD